MIDLNFINGVKTDDKNIISLRNPSFLYGVNCFEGIRGYYIKKLDCVNIVDLSEHIDRLISSINLLEFNISINKTELIDEINNIILHENIKENIYLRLTYFLDGEVSWRQKEKISYTLNIRSIDSYLGNSLPISLGISSYVRISRNTLPPFVKAGANYLNSRYALLDSEKRGFQGTLFLNDKGYISESSGSCIFFIKNNKLITPSEDCDILVGITRGRILEIAKKNNIKVKEQKIKPENISSFDFAFLAGTMIEIKPVASIEDYFFDKENKTYDFIVKMYNKYTKCKQE